MCSVCFFQGFGFAGTNRGKLLMMNVNKGSMPLELNLTNTPSAPNFMANPHGISTWKDEKTGSVLLSKSDSDDMFVYKGSLTLAMGKCLWLSVKIKVCQSSLSSP